MEMPMAIEHHQALGSLEYVVYDEALNEFKPKDDQQTLTLEVVEETWRVFEECVCDKIAQNVGPEEECPEVYKLFRSDCQYVKGLTSDRRSWLGVQTARVYDANPPEQEQYAAVNPLTMRFMYVLDDYKKSNYLLIFLK